MLLLENYLQNPLQNDSEAFWGFASSDSDLQGYYYYHYKCVADRLFPCYIELKISHCIMDPANIFSDVFI